MTVNGYQGAPPRITNELMAFCAVAKSHSFSKAAQLLGIGQPTVTEQVRRLEDEMDATLFDRSTRPVQLTPAGMQLERLAIPIFDSLSVLTQRIARHEVSDTVRVAASPAITDHVLPEVMRVFTSGTTGSQVHLRSHTFDDIVELVRTREVDLGVVPCEIVMSGLEFVPLFQYRWLLIAPVGHPVLELKEPSIEDISRWPIVVPRHSVNLTAWASLIEAMRSRNLPYRVSLELNQLDSLKKYVGIGLGISIMPAFALEHTDLVEIGACDMTHLFENETAGFIRPQGSKFHGLVDAFTSTLMAVVGRQTGYGRTSHFPARRSDPDHSGNGLFRDCLGLASSAGSQGRAS